MQGERDAPTFETRLPTKAQPHALPSTVAPGGYKLEMEFNSLPTEILINIFKQLCPHCRGEPLYDGSEMGYMGLFGSNHPTPEERAASQLSESAALSSLCLVSKQFHAIAQPILYHEYSLKPRPNDKYGSQILSLSSIVRTLILRRDLASLVKRGSISHRHQYRTNPQCSLATQTALADAYDALCSYLGFHLVVDVQGAKRRRNFVRQLLLFRDCVKIQHESFASGLEIFLPALFAGMLVLMPNLDSMALPLPKVYNTYRYRAMWEASGTQSISVKHLTMGNVHSLGTALAVTPHLESLNLRFFRGLFLSESDGPVSMPNLRVLRLIACFVDRYHLEYLLTSSGNRLETFVYSLFSQTHHRAEHQRDWHDFMADDPALEIFSCFSPQQKRTLRHLHLDLREVDGHDFRLAGIRDFEALEDVFISVRCWYPWWTGDVSQRMSIVALLPRNIKTLSIASSFEADWSELVVQLVALAEAQKRTEPALPFLRRINYDVPLQQGEYDKLSAALALSGIDFVCCKFVVAPEFHGDRFGYVE